MLSLSDSESERDPEEESDRLMFGAYLNAPDTTNQSSPKKVPFDSSIINK